MGLGDDGDEQKISLYGKTKWRCGQYMERGMINMGSHRGV